MTGSESPGCRLSAGVVPEPTGQAAKAGAGLAEVAPCGCGVGPPGAARWRCGPTVLRSAASPHSWPVAHPAVRDLPPPPGFRQPVFLGRRPPAGGPTEAARRMVRPPEEQSGISSVLAGLHAASGSRRLPLELKGGSFFSLVRLKLILKFWDWIACCPSDCRQLPSVDHSLVPFSFASFC